LPFTPFHMGVALVAKPGFNQNFSLITFGIAQIAMDIESGIGMLTDADVLHGPTCIVLGALVIAYLVMLIAPVVCSFILRKWNKEVTHHRLHWLAQPATTSKTAVTVGAFFGTLSHVFLDSLMHHDIHPLLPFSKANPLMGLGYSPEFGKTAAQVKCKEFATSCNVGTTSLRASPTYEIHLRNISESIISVNNGHQKE
jgi:hypothetical protein